MIIDTARRCERFERHDQVWYALILSFIIFVRTIRSGTYEVYPDNLHTLHLSIHYVPMLRFIKYATKSASTCADVWHSDRRRRGARRFPESGSDPWGAVCNRFCSLRIRRRRGRAVMGVWFCQLFSFVGTVPCGSLVWLMITSRGWWKCEI